MKFTRWALRAVLAVALLHGMPAHGQGFTLRPSLTHAFTSQVVGNTCTTVITAPPAVNGVRLRIVAVDETVLATPGTAPTVWCAWGTAAQNCAVPGSNGFVLNAGIDDSAPGVDATDALNCVQASGSHYVRLEQYF